jgi:hypothetical protein
MILGMKQLTFAAVSILCLDQVTPDQAALAQPAAPQADKEAQAKIRLEKQRAEQRRIRAERDGTAASPAPAVAAKTEDGISKEKTEEEMAAEKAKEAKFKVLKPGVIAGYGTVLEDTAVQADTSNSVPGEEASPISGGISKGKNGRCNVVLTNSHEKKSYSVSFSVVSSTGSGGSGTSRGYSATLPPKKSITREVPCKEDENMQVVLRSGKQLTK